MVVLWVSRRAILVMIVGGMRGVSMVPLVPGARSVWVATLIRCRYGAQIIREIAGLLHLIANSKLRILFENVHHTLMSLHLLLLLPCDALLATTCLPLFDLLNLTSIETTSVSSSLMSRCRVEVIPLFVHFLPLGESTLDTKRSNTHCCSVLDPSLGLFFTSFFGAHFSLSD